MTLPHRLSHRSLAAAARAVLTVLVPAVALALALPLSACGGDAFSGGGDVGDGSAAPGPDSDVIVGPDGGMTMPGMKDASMDASHRDADARADGPQPEASPREDAGPVDSGEVDSGPAVEAGVEASVEAGVDAPVGCPAGYLDCSGTCEPDDVKNCGVCGHDCTALPHVSGGVTCGAGGVCVFTLADCASGWTHCSSNPDTGCETSSTVSPNCGGCGVTCAGGTPVCNGTGCVSGCMGSTPTLCGGACVDTTSNPQDCSACSDVCGAGPANSAPDCVNSVCGYACNKGYTGCPTSAPTACDDLASDPANCGACARACAAPVNGATSCVASACAPACPGGLPTLCASQGPSGTCVNTTNDASNCTGCGVTCPGPVAGMGSAVCSGGCGVSCAGGTPNACGSEPSVSCVSFSDLANCGGCGVVCATKDPPPANAQSTCNGTSCGWVCDTSYELCGSGCLLDVPDPTAGVFVAQGGAMSSCGAYSAPCGSISAALNVVSQSAGSKTIVYVAEASTPYVEQVTLAAGVTIQGGWTYNGSAWGRPCTLDASQVVLQAPPGADRVVIASYNGTSGLDTLTVKNASAAAAGQTLYGIVESGTTTVLNVRNVDINVAKGGAAQQPATATGAGTSGSGTCSEGSGAPGGAQSPGSAAGSGTYSPAAYTPSSGGAGPAGLSGQAGTVVSAPTTYSTMAACEATGSTNPFGCGCTNSATSMGVPGLFGCPGAGSPGGAGGPGGGGSFGLFAWGGSVVLDNVTTSTGGGGAGAPGGAASTAVGTGSSGTTGANGPAVQVGCSTRSGSIGGCTTCSYPHGIGGVGGPGGNGGTGGAGGGGSGGDSYCFYDGTGSTVTVTSGSTFTCTPGTAGAGGGGGAANGASGHCNAGASCP